MDILVLNQDWFVEELRQFGHRVVTCGVGTHLDIVLECPLIHIDLLLKNFPEGFQFERVIVHDNSAPVIIDGLEQLDVPVIFYSVDAHHHASLHSYLAHAFDYSLIAQRDYTPVFEALGRSPEWMPLWASEVLEPSDEKQYGACFVGTLKKELNPDRVAFFEELQKEVPIDVRSGGFQTIFPQAELIVNQTVKGDLNFRVFEAMISGAALLTERSSNGLFELFRDDEQLLTYEKGNVAEAADKIRAALSDIPKLRRIAHAGREEILRAHMPVHRAKRFDELLRSVGKTDSPIRSFSWMVNFHGLASRLHKIDTALAAQALVRTLKAAEFGLIENEPLSQDLAIHFVSAVNAYERSVPGGAGRRLLERFAEAYPEQKILTLARVRDLLNLGNRVEASRLAEEIQAGKDQFVFQKSEEFVTELMNNYYDKD